MAEVLLVGSEDEFPAYVEECVRSNGHSPVRVKAAVHVLSTLNNGGGRLVFLDAGSAKYDPMDLLRKILSRQPDSRVVMTSEEPSVEFAVEVIKEGAWDFLHRPIEETKLELILQQALQPAVEAATAEGAVNAGDFEIITQDPNFLQVLSIAERAAAGNSSVLIQGESGTGKEMLARFIHNKSPRSSKPFLALNCAALPETLIESELFGHEKGAFTGAASRRLGKFELANSGTLLLDEITEMEAHLQAKLLRVLQEQTIDRLGGNAPIPVDVRVIATTNRPVTSDIESGDFREDLYYRLNVIPLKVPPLRERLDDVPLLARHFVEKHNIRNNKEVKNISDKLHETLQGMPWKGNVRELENTIERAVVLSQGPELLVEHLLLDEGAHPAPAAQGATSSVAMEPMVGQTVHDMERQLIISTLERVSDNRTRAAEMLGISIRTLRNKLKEYEASAEAQSNS